MDVPVSSSPYSTGPIWDTGLRDTYPPGTYTIWASGEHGSGLGVPGRGRKGTILQGKHGHGSRRRSSGHGDVLQRDGLGHGRGRPHGQNLPEAGPHRGIRGPGPERAPARMRLADLSQSSRRHRDLSSDPTGEKESVRSSRISSGRRAARGGSSRSRRPWTLFSVRSL